MKCTYKYRIYLTPAQITLLENIFSMCRHLYNWCLQERVEAYQKENRTVSYYEQQNNLPKLKKERPWFKGVYSLVLQDVLHRLDGAYQKFFKQKKGFPKFKKRGQYNSITYADHRNKPQGGFLDISKIGFIKIVYHREIPENAKIKTLSIVKDGGKWYVCFSLELPDPVEIKPRPTKAIGIDLGLHHFLYGTNGAVEEAPRHLKAKQKDLKRLQRKLSRQEKRTPEYLKTLSALQKAHYRIACRRTGFLQEIATKLLKEFDLVVHEDLNILPMTKRPEAKKGEVTGEYLPNGAYQKSRLNTSIYDASWRRFLNLLKHKAEKLGKWVIGVNPYMTSQICSSCQTLVQKSLSTRTHRCPECGYIADRDENAAWNILRLGLESLDKILEAPTKTLCV
jgi:putative transposase